VIEVRHLSGGLHVTHAADKLLVGKGFIQRLRKKVLLKRRERNEKDPDRRIPTLVIWQTLTLLLQRALQGL
jgi:hypothetical protein